MGFKKIGDKRQEITTITDEPIQRHTLVLENNETVDFRLFFKPRMQSWYYDFQYLNNEPVKGSKVTLSPNALRQYRKTLPFGFAFYTTDGDVEPFKLDDFSSGRVKFGILNAQEIEQIEKEIYNL